MSKKVAVLVVNPVNGTGLFQYLEAFQENGIAFKTFAVADSKQVRTNSGIGLQTDDVVKSLQGHAAEFDALVFACGDAMPKFSENADKAYNRCLVAVVKEFGDAGKMLIGHCVGALVFEIAGVSKGKQVAVHPFVKSALKNSIGTDAKAVVDGNLYTAQTENALSELIPEVLKKLK